MSCLALELSPFLHLYSNYDHCNLSFVGASGKSKTWQFTSQGEEKIELNVYELMCKLFLEGENAENIFTHIFLILEWNLIAQLSIGECC